MHVLYFCLFVLAGIIFAAYITNPFARFSVVKRPFAVTWHKGRFAVANNNDRLHLHQSWPWRTFAILKCFVHVLTTRYVHSPEARASTVDGIIADIHAHRFKPTKLLLTSGDHFSALFARNLGVFYYPMLDTSIAGSETDWQHRQIVYLQTIAYALGVFAKHGKPVTTIVTTGRYAATCVNIYAYPSDALYGVLYALAASLGQESAHPDSRLQRAHHTLHTQAVAAQLLAEYKPTLQKLYAHYRATVFDEQTGLIRTDRHLSGAKDITRRTCAFYDNVIFWKTTQLAAALGLIDEDKTFQRKLKTRILKTFWLEPEGYFLEDLSPEGVAGKYYSSDWLIVLATGFLKPSNPRERRYFERSIAYIQDKGIDQPFAIKYQHERRASRQFILVRLTMASYGGNAIWSFWGMEYIKALLLLYEQTGTAEYLVAAKKHLKAYERTMLRDHGFPEVYDKHGDLLETPIYRSIRQTGWVIGFEQARTLLATVTKKNA